MQQVDFYKDIIDSLSDGVYFIDQSRVINSWNKGAERLTGYTAQQMVGQSCCDNPLDLVTPNGDAFCSPDCPLIQAMLDGKELEAEVFFRHASGHRVPIVIHAAPLWNGETRIVGAVISFNRNTRLFIENRQELRELQRASITDPLTGVGNRKYIESRLSELIAEFETTSRGAGLLFIDVDHFKRFNDLYGHMTGDDVLRLIAKTILYMVRTTDMVGRWGGEEFVVILYDVPDQESLQAVAEKLRAQVQYSRLDLKGFSLEVTISIGGTVLQPGDTQESFVQRADSLLYASKQSGRNRVTVA